MGDQVEFFLPEEVMVTVSEVIRDRRVTAVKIEVAVYEPKEASSSGVRISKQFVGTSVRNVKEDKYDYDIGMNLAMSRALEKASKSLKNSGWGKIKFNENRAKSEERNKERSKVIEKEILIQSLKRRNRNKSE